MGRCPQCSRTFFHITETRMLPETFNHAGEGVLIIKKRCKACNAKSLWQKVYPGGQTHLCDEALWKQGVRVPNSIRKPVCAGGQIIISNYSRQVSRHADRVVGYLNQVEKAERRSKQKAARHG